MIIFLGSFNCRITWHYKKDGELAILAGTFSLLLFSVYYAIALALSNGYTEFGMIKDHMPYTGGIILAYNSFILIALYGSKV